MNTSKKSIVGYLVTSRPSKGLTRALEETTLSGKAGLTLIDTAKRAVECFKERDKSIYSLHKVTVANSHWINSYSHAGLIHIFANDRNPQVTVETVYYPNYLTPELLESSL